MTDRTIQTSIQGLVKLAEQMVDAVESTQKVGPDEAYDALEGIISQLEALAQSIPASGGNEAEPTQTPIPKETPKEDPRVASLEKTVKQLTSQLESQKRAEIAQEFASYFSEPKKANEKEQEILNSKDSLDVLQAKLDSIAELAESNGISPTKTAKSFTSYVRVAQLNNSRMHTL
jgi:wobble nucleotide-excising tRNase